MDVQRGPTDLSEHTGRGDRKALKEIDIKVEHFHPKVDKYGSIPEYECVFLPTYNHVL